MVMPGDNVSLEIELHTPVAMEKGLRFAIREGGRTVGAGTITEIVKQDWPSRQTRPLGARAGAKEKRSVNEVVSGNSGRGSNKRCTASPRRIG